MMSIRKGSSRYRPIYYAALLGLCAGSLKRLFSIQRSASVLAGILALLSVSAHAQTLVPDQTSFFFGIQFGDPQESQLLNLTSTGGNVNFTAVASVVTPTGVNWLRVSPGSGSTPRTLTITVNVAGLAPANADYQGFVTIISPGASNSPITIPVALNVFGVREMRVNTTSFGFQASAGGSSGHQVLQVTSDGIHIGELNFRTTTTTLNGGNWLLVNPGTGTTPRALGVSANAASLSPGSYGGVITVTDTAGRTILVQASLDVTAVTSILAVSTNSQSFSTAVGANPGSQSFQISNTGSGVMNWTASATTQSGGNWLSVNPNSGAAPSTVTVQINAAQLAQGSYSGTVTVTAAGTSGSPQTINVNLAVGVPLVFPNGVVNGASFSTDAVISAGSIASLFGERLASGTAVATALPLPTSLVGTQLFVNNSAVPLFFVSPGQINFQMPPGLEGATVQVAVSLNGAQGAERTVNLSPAVPGIFTRNQDGTGQGAILNQDFSANSAQNRAARGSVIQIYCTGLGATNPALPAGQPGATSEPLNRTTLIPVVTIGNVQAAVQFSAVAPGFVGLYQVNVVVPANIAAGDAVPIQIQIGGRTSNTATVAVQ